MTRQPRSRAMTSRDKQAAERREQLLESAKSLFAEKGFHATSTRMICQKIGMADGLLYHYFPDGKMEMLQTIMKEGHERRVALVDESRHLHDDDPNVPLRQKLLEFARALYGILQSDLDLLRIQFRERELFDPSVVDFMSASIRERQRHMANVLERRAARGEIREMDYEMAALQVMSINLTAMFRVLTGIDLIGEDIEAYRERIVDHLLDSWKRT
ncbi:TetR/AcrR family transcriptional regulator [Paenibacillus flagellatus]|uniref:HTH tetR-type domain-containing protein n=1 Tax=Paenibacillus flagellatus TaxID=2211139 RepID=A0A2V5K279_9BACL|nr:TetR/AcrR family transcriptional regulator [Paenibacillus flagellatus]PYI53335.1 hypothetical protein DLM86_16235 [Paenibacillus flagellatus]